MHGLLVILLIRGIICVSLSVCHLWESDSYYAPLVRTAAFLDFGIQQASQLLAARNITLRMVRRNVGPACSRGQQTAVRVVYDMLYSGERCSVIVGMGCARTVSVLYGFARYFQSPLLAIPGAGLTSVQSNSSIHDFPLLVQPTFSLSDLTEFIVTFLLHQNYTHLSVIRDDSYSFFRDLSLSFVKVLREMDYDLYRETDEQAVRSKVASMEVYGSVLQNANDRSRGKYIEQVNKKY